MRSLSSTRIYGLVLVLTTIVVLETSIHSNIFAQENKKSFDMILLSHNYNSKAFADEIVGSILNNGTATIKAVEITAIFYDDQDEIIGNADSGTSPYTVNQGDSATFTIELFDEAVKINATSYDFTAKWQDEYLSSSYFTRFTGDETSESSGGEDDEEDDENLQF